MGMEIRKLIDIVATNYHSVKNKDNWEKFATENQLFSYEETKNLFNNSWKEFKKQVFIRIAKSNINYFYTPKYWDRYAREKDLPVSNQFRALFNDWNNAITLIHEGKTAEEIKLQFLVTIASANKDKFLIQREWDQYAVANDLPISATFKNHFGSWSEAVEVVTGIRLQEKRYTKQRLLLVMKEHKEHLITQDTWQKFAAENNLPSVNTLANHFGSFNAAKEKVGCKKIQKRIFSPEELFQIAMKYRDVFHLPLWNFYSSTYFLPTETAYINHFGDFRNIQKKIGVVNGEYTEQTVLMKEKAIKDKKRTLLRLIASNQELVQSIYLEWNLFDSRKAWDKHAISNEKPTFLELLAIFNTKRQLKQTIYIYIALQNKEKFHSNEWDEYAALNNYPNKMKYYNLFTSWDYVQQMIWGSKEEAKKEYLLCLAKEHIQDFTTYKNWSNYAKKHNLPSVSQYESSFGSWNKAKEEITNGNRKRSS